MAPMEGVFALIRFHIEAFRYFFGAGPLIEGSAASAWTLAGIYGVLAYLAFGYFRGVMKKKRLKASGEIPSTPHR